jgi:hypothetical protein
MVLDASHVESWQLAKTGNKYNIQEEVETRAARVVVAVAVVSPPWWWWF